MRQPLWVAWNVLVALSLLLCLASIVFWVRSYQVRDIVGYGWASGNSHTAQSIHGRLHVLTDLGGGYTGGTHHQADRLSPQATWHGGMSGYPLVGDVRWRCGFVWQTYNRSHFGGGQPFRRSKRLIIVPYWFPAGVFALAPIAWAAGARRRVGLLDLILIAAAVALVLALPALLARSMNQAVPMEECSSQTGPGTHICGFAAVHGGSLPSCERI
jgi:hypothetical protein